MSCAPFLLLESEKLQAAIRDSDRRIKAIRNVQDYQLENLGPERFQDLCYALVTKAFPTPQCFSIRQRN